MPPTSRKLAIPRSGVGRMTRLTGNKPVSGEQGVTIASWQSPERGAPKRVIIRCDGSIVKQLATTGVGGFPCAVLAVRYTIGGLTKEVLIDAGGQSALTVWAESVDVTPVWDERRIARIDFGEDTCCEQQLLAAAISSDGDVGDTGIADARWLDAIHTDAQTGGGEFPTTVWSIHPVPEGARGVRFLDGLVDGAMFSVPGATTIIAWSADTFDNYPNGLVQLNTNGATDTSILIVPTCARYLFLAFDEVLPNFQTTAWLEWIMAPATLPGF